MLCGDPWRVVRGLRPRRPGRYWASPASPVLGLTGLAPCEVLAHHAPGRAHPVPGRQSVSPKSGTPIVSTASVMRTMPARFSQMPVRTMSAILM